MLSLRIDKKIEEQFRKTIGELRGTHRGNLKNALEEALFMWIQTYRKGHDIGIRIGYKQEMQRQAKIMKEEEEQIQRELEEKQGEKQQEEEKQDTNESKE